MLLLLFTLITSELKSLIIDNSGLSIIADYHVNDRSISTLPSRAPGESVVEPRKPLIQKRINEKRLIKYLL